MDLGVLFAPLTSWLDAHPAVVSWVMGWLAAICAGQTLKQLLPPTWSVTSAKRSVQMIATVAGSWTAYLLWPPTGPHAVVYSLIVGMSAPTAYTFGKAIIEARWPTLAYRLSWLRVQDRAHVCNGDPCTDPDCTKVPK